MALSRQGQNRLPLSSPTLAAQGSSRDGYQPEAGAGMISTAGSFLTATSEVGSLFRNGRASGKGFLAMADGIRLSQLVSMNGEYQLLLF